MKFQRTYSTPDDAYAGIAFEPRTSRIVNPDGSVIFEAADVMVPASWSQVAVDVLAQKYCRKAGMPKATKRVDEPDVPEWLRRSVADEAALAEVPRDEQFGPERDSRQVFNRLAGCWTYWGWKHGYFDSENDARIYHDEMCAMLARQIGAPNSPQFFNTGSALGVRHLRTGAGTLFRGCGERRDAALAGFVHASAGQRVLHLSELKTTSSTKAEFSTASFARRASSRAAAVAAPTFRNCARAGEKLTGGGTSSGLMSFLKVFDRAAGAIKSGGTTRRAAKMVVLDADHPDIEEFVNWKVREERKVADLVVGSRMFEKHVNAIIAAAHDTRVPEHARLDPALNASLRHAIREAIGLGIPTGATQAALDYARQGYTHLEVEQYDTAWDSEAYITVSGQNSNNSVRLTNEFFKRVDADGDWDLTWRTNGGLAKKIKARDLWEQIGLAAWHSADPGLQYDDTIQEWHTCAADDRINATNPCVTGHTLVATADGPKRIEDLVGKAAFVIGGDGRPHFVNRIFPTGTKPVYRLELSGGYSVDLTADHRVLTANRGDVAAADLHAEDDVVVYAEHSVHAAVGAGAVESSGSTNAGYVSLTYLGERPVFDLSESDTQHFVANGVVVHNCSEYVFIDDTSCNLASLNLVKFLNNDGNFDTRRFAEAARVWTTTLEISVTMGQMPSKSIAEKNHLYRTLGLGYANLGTLLMRMGLPYDSEEGFGWCAAISALLTGTAYRTSAEMAQKLGPFARFEANREPMLRVIRNHRRAAYNAQDAEYEQLSTKPVTHAPTLFTQETWALARKMWDDALSIGEVAGFRNAQTVVIAPTGCLTGNSLVVTDRGLARLNRLGNPDGAKWQDVDFRVLTDDGDQRATKFFINGIEPTRRIRTKSGYTIQGTPTHRVKVVDPQTGDLQWKRMAEIGAGNVVALSMGGFVGAPREVTLPDLSEQYWTTDYSTRVPRRMTPDLAELIGYFMGDGSFHSKGLRFCVSQQDGDVVDRLRVLAKDLFNLDAAVAQKRGYVEVAFHSVPLTMWWEACGLRKLPPSREHRGKGYTPRVPDAVLAANDPAVYAAFVRGLFEADGTVTAGMPTWSTASADFAEEVKVLLLMLQLPTTTRTTISGWGRSAISCTRLLNASYSKHFLETVGFMGSRKRSAVTYRVDWQGRKHDNVYIGETLCRELVARRKHQQGRHLQIPQA